jgi:[1-hydroxy-2-(trimethylamino)ethyl]phosphonate dioxygenase
MDCIAEIIRLFEQRGSSEYLGEPVSQLEHALQAAHLAVLDGACDALVSAALLHDIGHLLGSEEDPALAGIDALHQDRACTWLAPHFGPNVTEPVRLHVLAKRYLCTTDAEYHHTLSPTSLRSLELQGGLLNEEEIQRFESHAYAKDAVRLRRWDDRAKIAGLAVPDLAHYAATLRRASLPAITKSSSPVHAK